MNLIQRIVALFARYPKHHVSAYSALYASVVAALQRNGVNVGGTAGYPRVEVHTITESERLDKEGETRSLSLTVESISNRSVAEADQMNDYNLEALTGADLNAGEKWCVLGVVPGLLQDLTETADTQAIIYRLLQQFTVFVSAVKSNTPPTPPATQSAGDTEAAQDTTINS